MTEEFDIMEAFQRIRQQLHDTRQPRNLGLVAEALQPTTFQLNHDGMTVPHISLTLDGADISRAEYSPADGRWIAHDDIYNTLDEDEDDDDDDDNEDLINIMDGMAWAYLPYEIRNDICSKFYHGKNVQYQILLTIHDPAEQRPVVTAASVEVKRDDFGTHLSLDGEVIAWYAMNNPLDDEYSPIFFDYAYNKLGTFFLGAAQLLWGALGYETFIVDSRYIHDDESLPWEAPDNAELSAYTFHRIKQIRQLSGNFGVFKKKVRNARRRRNLY